MLLPVLMLGKMHDCFYLLHFVGDFIQRGQSFYPKTVGDGRRQLKKRAQEVRVHFFAVKNEADVVR